jgi:hypothetical protein
VNNLLGFRVWSLEEPMRISLALASLLSVLAGSATVCADDGFRCRTGRLVSVGDRMGEVQNRCGEPDAVTTRIEKRKVKHRYSRWFGGIEESIVEEVEVEVPLDEWTYDLGPQSFIRYVVFENGSVINVTTGGYGRR